MPTVVKFNRKYTNTQLAAAKNTSTIVEPNDVTSGTIYIANNGNGIYIGDNSSPNSILRLVGNVDESGMFVSTYGTTTYQQIVDAYAAGKVVICSYKNRIYSLTKIIQQYVGFSVCWGESTHFIKVTNSNVWSTEDVDFYIYPNGGIPKTDLASDVQTSLENADNAVLYTSQSLSDSQKTQARNNIAALARGTTISINSEEYLFIKLGGSCTLCIDFELDDMRMTIVATIGEYPESQNSNVLPLIVNGDFHYFFKYCYFYKSGDNRYLVFQAGADSYNASVTTISGVEPLDIVSTASPIGTLQYTIELREVPDDNVLMFSYGDNTTAQDVISAHERGCICICNYYNGDDGYDILPLTGTYNEPGYEVVYFGACYGNKIYYVSLTTVGWGNIATTTIPTALSQLTSDSTHRIVTDTEKSTWNGYGTSISNIESKIPAQATAQNQLADKNFVNSSIQTETATFRGNYETWRDVPEEDSQLVGGDADNNDYMVVRDASGYASAWNPYGEYDVKTYTIGDVVIYDTILYVCIQDVSYPDPEDAETPEIDSTHWSQTTSNPAYEGTWRFKYVPNGSSYNKYNWQPEYQVNEKPLTAEQLAALNSGITAEKVTKLDNLPSTIPTEIFWATYGTTTAAEIDAAIAAGKAVMCRYSDCDYVLSKARAQDGYYYFGGILGSSFCWLRLQINNSSWVAWLQGAQLISNKVNSWQSTPDNNHYPSEKLVKDSLDAKYEKPSDGIPASDLSSDAQESLNKCIPITYSALKAKRNNETLVPGCWYRIIDYATTTSQEDTRSAGNQFDVVVLALSNNTLSEEARAIQHEECKYTSITNSSNTYSYIDTVNITFNDEHTHKIDRFGVLGSDEYWCYTDDDDTYYIGFSALGGSDYTVEDGNIITDEYSWGDRNYDEPVSVTYTYFGQSNLNAWKIWYCLDNDTMRFAWADEGHGKGVIYRMIDEWNNDCPYDFKNIQFKRMISLENGYPELDTDSGTDTWVFTFTATSYNIGDDSWSELKDGSLESSYGHESDESSGTFHDNIIGKWIKLLDEEDEDYTKCGIQYLNDNVFLGYWEEIGSGDPENYPYYYAYCSYNNKLGKDCYNNTFENECRSNIFGNNCRHNIFGTYCSNNTFGNECWSNAFKNSCSSNTFGDGCWSNAFKNSCSSNTFGNGCSYNTFGYSCCYNTFENECHDNTFGDNYYNNTFGNNCFSNTFGDDCWSNTFGNRCYYNIFGTYCSNNTFGNECFNIKFGNTSITRGYYKNIMIDNGNGNIYLYCSSTTSDAYSYQNVRVALGVNNTNSWKTITDANTNQTFETVYRSANSQNITV